MPPINHPGVQCLTFLSALTVVGLFALAFSTALAGIIFLVEAACLWLYFKRGTSAFTWLPLGEVPEPEALKMVLLRAYSPSFNAFYHRCLDHHGYITQYDWKMASRHWLRENKNAHGDNGRKKRRLLAARLNGENSVKGLEAELEQQTKASRQRLQNFYDIRHPNA